MSLKDDLKVVKQELSSDEKLLEQAFQLEKFYKKHKKKILATIIILVIALIGYNGYRYYIQTKLTKANEALLALFNNPDNKKALEELKANNIKLYNLYSYNIGANSENKNSLEQIKTDDKILIDLINYHKGVIDKKPIDSIYYKNLALVEKAYLRLKNGDKDGAKNILISVDKNSPVAPVARLLMHYTIK